MKAKPQLTSLILLAAFAALGFAQATPSGYTFTGGYPTPEPVQKTYDDADLNRAVQAGALVRQDLATGRDGRGEVKVERKMRRGL